MALTYRAAAPFSYFGVDYAAGDPIDTTDWGEEDIRRLFTHEPVYVDAGSGGSASVDQIVLLLPAAATGIADGTDYYPTLAVDSVLGSSLTLDADGNTVHAAPGVYDVCCTFQVGWGGAAVSGTVYLYVDGLGAAGCLFNGDILGGVMTVTLQGLMLSVATDLALNIEVDGAGAWYLNVARFAARRVGDAA